MNDRKQLVNHAIEAVVTQAILIATDGTFI